MNKTKTIRCSCYSEMIHFTWDEEIETLDVSIWAPYSTDTTMSWKQRLRYCWQILTKGRPYGDQVIMEKEHIADLVDFLIKIQNPEVKGNTI